MRKSASEIINNLESRVARLERQAIMHPSMLNRDFFNEEDHTPNPNKNRAIEKKVLKKIEEHLIRDGKGSRVSVNGDYESLELKETWILTTMGVKEEVMRRAFQTDTDFSIGLIRTTYENGDRVSFGLGKGNGTFRNGLQLFIWK